MHFKKKLEFLGHSAAIYSIDGISDFFYTCSGDKFVAKWNSILGTQEKFSVKLNETAYKIRLINKGRHLVVGTSSGAVHIIDLDFKQEIKHFIQHKSAIFEIQEDEKYFFTSDADGNFAVWDKLSFELKLFLPLDCGKIRSIYCYENIIYLACQNGEIKLFDKQNFNEVHSFLAHSSGTNSLLIDENLLISAGKDGYLRFWDKAINFNLIKAIPAHNFGIYKIDFLNNGENLVSVSRDKSIKVWDTKRYKVIQKIERKHGGHSHAINSFWKKSENEFITVGDDKRIILWEGIEIEKI